MISEKSCDTEDWSTDADQIQFWITGIKSILKYYEIENNYFNL